MTQKQYDDLKARKKELEAYANSRDKEEKALRDEYWAVLRLMNAHEDGQKAAELAKRHIPISDRLIPWSGDIDENIKEWCDTLEENNIISLALEANQSTSFGCQIASFFRAGWCISSCARGEDGDVLFLTRMKDIS